MMYDTFFQGVIIHIVFIEVSYFIFLHSFCLFQVLFLSKRIIKRWMRKKKEIKMSILFFVKLL